MDACTRPSHTRRQTRRPQGYRLAAFFCCSLVLAAPAIAAANPRIGPGIGPGIAPENEETSSISPSLEHEISITQVKPGQETATLSARLTEINLSLAKDVTWRVRNGASDLVYDDRATTAAMALAPGYYTVEARFGAITLEESFTLLEGNSITLNFVLNAGALRILPRIKGMLTADINSHTRIFALSGKAKGKLVKETDEPGEVISLTAGRYRLENRMVLGNALAVTDVKVQPGVMSAVEIDHHAGLARLSYVGAADAKVEWQIMRGPVMELGNINSLNASVVLRPGNYTAVARVGGERLTASFQIREGEARDIMLGN